MTQEEISAVLRSLAEKLGGTRSDVAALLEINKTSADDRVRLHNDMREIDRRLTKVEFALDALVAQAKAEAPTKAKVATWLAVGSTILFMAGAIIPQLLLDLWRSSR